MRKLILTLLGFFFVGFLSAQTPIESTKTQEELNKEKAQLLKDKLNGISIDSTQVYSSNETIIPRLANVEEELDSLNRKMNELLDLNKKLYLLLLNQDKKITQLTSLSNAETTTQATCQSGHYVVVESQLTYNKAVNGQKKHAKKLGVELKLIKSKTGTWYYLVLDDVFEYSQAQKKVKELKKQRYKDAWLVPTENVVLE